MSAFVEFMFIIFRQSFFFPLFYIINHGLSVNPLDFDDKLEAVYFKACDIACLEVEALFIDL